MKEHFGAPLFGVRELFSRGFELSKEHWLKYIALAIVTSVSISLISGLLRFLLGDLPMGNVLIQLVLLVPTVIVQIAFTRYVLFAVDKKSIELKTLFAVNWQMIFAVLVSSLLYGLIVFFGLILLIIPGIIFALGCYFYFFLIVDKQLGAIDSLRTSWHITKGHKGTLFVFYLLSGLPVFVLGATALGLVVNAWLGSSSLLPVIVVGSIFLVIAVIMSLIITFGSGFAYRKMESAR